LGLNPETRTDLCKHNEFLKLSRSINDREHESFKRNHRDRRTRAENGTNGPLGYQLENAKTRSNRYERDLRRDLGLNPETPLEPLQAQRILKISGASMTENTNLLNEIIAIEELEPKTAPTALWDTN
jgi:hypothetical protein